ncbi:MAG: hypothetical protein AB7Q17_05965 [Phycisphaerae bacterium]
MFRHSEIDRRRSDRPAGQSPAAIFWLGLALVWIVGVWDYELSRQLINASGLDAELNPLARGIAARFGSASLLAYKATLLAVFTTAAVIAAARSRRVGRHVMHFGVAVHGLLAAWWQVVLLTPAAD